MRLTNKCQFIQSAIMILGLFCMSSVAFAEMTIEQRVERAIASPSISWVEMQLKNIPEGTPRRGEVVAHLDQLKKQQVIAEKKKTETDARNMAEARRKYGEALRYKFLDNSMDIKVKVVGKQSTELVLKYALISDVWLHKFKKGSLINEIADMGFKKIEFTDGYDYDYEITFDK